MCKLYYFISGLDMFVSYILNCCAANFVFLLNCAYALATMFDSGVVICNEKFVVKVQKCQCKPLTGS